MKNHSWITRDFFLPFLHIQSLKSVMQCSSSLLINEVSIYIFPATVKKHFSKTFKHQTLCILVVNKFRDVIPLCCAFDALKIQLRFKNLELHISYTLDNFVRGEHLCRPCKVLTIWMFCFGFFSQNFKLFEFFTNQIINYVLLINCHYIKITFKNPKYFERS